jgi:hypothetical protein
LLATILIDFALFLRGLFLAFDQVQHFWMFSLSSPIEKYVCLYLYLVHRIGTQKLLRVLSAECHAQFSRGIKWLSWLTPYDPNIN